MPPRPVGCPGRPGTCRLLPRSPENAGRDATPPRLPAGPAAAAPPSGSEGGRPRARPAGAGREGGGQGAARCVPGARAITGGAARRHHGPMAAPAMAEPRSKRPRVTLPACPAHRPLADSRVRQSFPPAVEEGLCGVTSALLELAYSLQALVRRRAGAGRGGPGRARCGSPVCCPGSRQGVRRRRCRSFRRVSAAGRGEARCLPCYLTRRDAGARFAPAPCGAAAGWLRVRAAAAAPAPRWLLARVVNWHEVNCVIRTVRPVERGTGQGMLTSVGITFQNFGKFFSKLSP